MERRRPPGSGTPSVELGGRILRSAVHCSASALASWRRVMLPWATRISPSFSPPSFWISSARSSSASVTSPRSTKISPSGRLGSPSPLCSSCFGWLCRHLGGRRHDLERRLLGLRRRGARVRPLEVRPLLREHARELDAGHAEVLDEDLSEVLFRLDLDRKSSLELLLGNEAALEEDGADQPGRNWIRRTHVPIHRQSLVRAIGRFLKSQAAESRPS